MPRTLSPTLTLAIRSTAVFLSFPIPRVAAADLHLTQQFQVRSGPAPLVRQERHIYVKGKHIALQSPQVWLIVRPDHQDAWVLDPNRILLATVPID